MTIRKSGAIIGGLQRADAALDATSTKPIQNKAVKTALDAISPIIGTTAPTTSTVGSVGQLYVDTTTSKTYHCTAKTNTGTEEEPVWIYTWEDDINAKGGIITGDIRFYTTGQQLSVRRSSIMVGDLYYLSRGGESTLVMGKSVYPLNTHDGIFVGTNLVANGGYECIYTGRYNIRSASNTISFLVGGGYSEQDRQDAIELWRNGDAYFAGGVQQHIVRIPAATTAYTLAEGISQHEPTSATTYRLPNCFARIVFDNVYFSRDTTRDGDGYYCWKEYNLYYYTASPVPSTGDYAYTNTALTSGAKQIHFVDLRTHECILTVRFSASVLTYAFEDSAGNPITPLPLAGTIVDGSVVCFRCTWEELLGQWVVMPVMLGTYEEVTP